MSTPVINQNALISALVNNPSLIGSIRSEINPQIWTTKAQRFIVKSILALYDQNGIAPRRSTLLRVVDRSVDREDFRQDVHNIISSVYSESVEESKGIFTEELLTQVRKLARLSAAQKYIDLVSKDKFDQADREIEKTKHIGVSSKGYSLLDPDNYKRICDPSIAAYDRKGVISTGFDLLDASLRGGIGYPELHVVCGKSGDGKSRFVNNIAANVVKQGGKVLYVTLEMDEPIVAARTWQILTGQTIDQLKEPQGLMSVEDTVRLIEARGGLLEVKRFPEYTVSCDDVEGYIIRLGIQFDLVILDYLDLMINTKSTLVTNEWKAEGMKFAEARRMSGNVGSSCLTVLQPKNFDNEEGPITPEKARGAYGKIDAMDSFMSLNADEDARDRGEFDLIFGKNRHGPPRVSLRFGYEGDTMRVHEMERVY